MLLTRYILSCWWFIPTVSFNKITRAAMVLVFYWIGLRNIKESLLWLDGMHSTVSRSKYYWEFIGCNWKSMKHLEPQSPNLTLLESAIHQEWSQVSQTTHQYLVESIPRRIKAVIKAKIGLRKYRWIVIKFSTQCIFRLKFCFV